MRTFIHSLGLSCAAPLAALLLFACESEPARDLDEAGGDGDERSDADDPERADDADDDDDERDERDADAGRDAGGARDAAIDAGRGAERDAGSTTRPTRDGGNTGPSRPSADAGSDGATPPGSSAGGGMSVSGIPEAELEQLRQVCIDEINMYRATLSLAPLSRPSPAHELCSDQGAKKDGDTRTGHSSAGTKNPCHDPSMRPPFPGFGAQNTCPGWPVGRQGAGTIADALKGCLKQMWAEGEPPGGEAQCIADFRAGNTACFLAHGHYINMKSPTAKGVACGFYDMGSNTYWMNQDFL